MSYKGYRVCFLLFLCTASFLVTACRNPSPHGSLSEQESEKKSQKEVVRTEASVLVVYFSPTGTTRKVALDIAEVLSTDIHEIVPEIPYSKEDLMYYTNGRADQEQADVNSRPRIAGDPINIDAYEIIIIGYPIWHGQTPRILNTFLESHDFSEKTILPFCTSHSSGIGSSASNLQDLTSQTTTWLEGRRFDALTEIKELQEWLVEEGIKP